MNQTSDLVKILFENKDIIICDKPSLVLSTPDRQKSGRPCLGLALQDLKKTQIFPVHRLDFEVSGLIMYAKNERAHKSAQEWFQQKTIQKKYQALTPFQSFAHWPDKVKTDKTQLEIKVGHEFLWKTQILRGKKRSFESDQGAWAETKAKIVHIDHEQKLIQWELFPITGKPHQLRLELSRRGFPILGDQLYGSNLKLSVSQAVIFGALALRSVEIQFIDLNKDRLGLPEKFEITNLS